MHANLILISIIIQKFLIVFHKAMNLEGKLRAFSSFSLPPEVTQNKVTIYGVGYYLTHFRKLSFETVSRAMTHHLNIDSVSDSKSSFFEDGYKLGK